MYAAVINVIQNVTRTACTESSPWTGATRKFIFGGEGGGGDYLEKLLPRSLGVIVNLAPRFRNNVNKRFECTRGCTRRAGLLPVYLRPPALVYANRLTGSIYVGTINPHRPRGIIFRGCKSTRSARAPKHGMFPNSTADVGERERKELKKKRRYPETAPCTSKWRERVRHQRNAEGACGEQKPRENAEGKSGKLYDYLATP